MATVVISPRGVVNAPDLGGHFWVYMQYAQGLLRSGCEVYWLERFQPTADRARDAAVIREFLNRIERYNLAQRVILYTERRGAHGRSREFIGGIGQSKAEGIFKSADLLLNFDYSIDPELLSWFQQTALVDIDPGLLQFWIGTGQLIVPRHKVYFTTGETVGEPGARFPDCGITWTHIRPPVCLELWPYAFEPTCEVFTTVSSWWGDEWITDGKDCYENNKRVSFLDFVELPRMTSQMLELALYLGDHPARSRKARDGFQPKHPFMSDQEHRSLLESYGWRIRHAAAAAGTPELYQSYIQRSRGEFSCAKPSCMKFQNAWVSDRTLCYMSTGKPVVVQDTGPSACLPRAEGMFRFSTLEEAVYALEVINTYYARHSRAARDIVETYFDAKKTSQTILNAALGMEAPEIHCTGERGAKAHRDECIEPVIGHAVAARPPLE